jgi:hypothetical protein
MNATPAAQRHVAAPLRGASLARMRRASTPDTVTGLASRARTRACWRPGAGVAADARRIRDTTSSAFSVGAAAGAATTGSASDACDCARTAAGAARATTTSAAAGNSGAGASEEGKALSDEGTVLPAAGTSGATACGAGTGSATGAGCGAGARTTGFAGRNVSGST